MVALKTREISGFLTQPDEKYPIILVYGPNSGLMSERVDGLIQKFNIDKNDSFSYQRFEANDLVGEKTLLVEEAHSISMFGGGMRLIHVRGSSAAVTAAVNAVLLSPPVENRIIIEAGDLPKTHGLRKAIEKSQSAAAIPCYADDEKTLAPLVDETVKRQSLSINNDARNMILHLIGNERALIKSELEKLTLSCHGQEQISLEDIQANLMDASSASVDEIVDTILKAQHKSLLTSITRYFNNGGETTPLVLGLSRGFSTLANIVEKGEQIGIDQAVERSRPPIFFKRKSIFKMAARHFNNQKIAEILAIISKLEKVQRIYPATAQNQITRGCLEIIQVARRK